MFFNPEPSISLKTGITSLFGLSNIYLLRLSTDYFADSTQLNAFTHTWSLDLEEQFYIVFPLLIWFTGFASQKKKWSQKPFLNNVYINCYFACCLYLYIPNR